MWLIKGLLNTLANAVFLLFCAFAFIFIIGLIVS